MEKSNNFSNNGISGSNGNIANSGVLIDKVNIYSVEIYNDLKILPGKTI